MTICISYINYNEENRVFENIDSIPNFIKNKIKILVVDNSSSFNFEDSGVEIIRIGNVGFSGGCNAAINFADENNFESLLILNPDVIFDYNELFKIEKTLLSGGYSGFMFPAVDEKGECLYDSIEFNGLKTKYKFKDDNSKVTLDTDYIAGCAMFLNISLIHSLRFDENLFLYFEEVDFSIAIKKVGNGIKSYLGCSVIRHSNGREKIINSIPYMWKSAGYFSRKNNVSFFHELYFKLYLLKVYIKNRFFYER